MDLSWILDEEWGVYNVTFEGAKGTFSSRPLKKKGRRTPDHRLIYTTRTEKNKYEKDMVSNVLLPLAIASNFFSSR